MKNQHASWAFVATFAVIGCQVRSGKEDARRLSPAIVGSGEPLQGPSIQREGYVGCVQDLLRKHCVDERHHSDTSPGIAHGDLLSFVEGAPWWRNAMLVGTGEALTFAYRTDNVMLLGVHAGQPTSPARRQTGDFMLRPSGDRIRAYRGGKPMSMFVLRDADGSGPDRDLVAHFVAAGVEQGGVQIVYELFDPSGVEPGKPLARVTEKPSLYRCRIGVGWKREFRIEGLRNVESLLVYCERSLLHEREWMQSGQRGSAICPVDPDGCCDVLGYLLRTDPTAKPWTGLSNFGIHGGLREGETQDLTLLHVPGIPGVPPASAGNTRFDVHGGLFEPPE